MDLNQEKLEALKYLTNRYIENVWKHTSIHLIALGWVLASKQIHELIANSLVMQSVISVVFIALECIHWFVNRPIYARIVSLSKAVSSIYGTELSMAYMVTRSRFFLNEVMILSLAVVGIIFIWMYPVLLVS